MRWERNKERGQQMKEKRMEMKKSEDKEWKGSWIMNEMRCGDRVGWLRGSGGGSGKNQDE